MATALDYKTRFISRQSIAATAYKLLRRYGYETKCCFDITRLIEYMAADGLDDGRRMRLIFFSASVGAVETFVRFDRPDEVTLSIDRELWKMAKLGEPDPKFKLAHEIGHLVLHDHYRLNFSPVDAIGLRSAQEEECVEGQANLFASYLLLSNPVVYSIQNTDTIVNLCSVSRPLAQRRLAEVNDKIRVRTHKSVGVISVL